MQLYLIVRIARVRKVCDQLRVCDATKVTFCTIHWYSHGYTDVTRPSRFSCEGLACETNSWLLYHNSLDHAKMGVVRPKVRVSKNFARDYMFTPPPSQLFFNAGKERERARDLKSRDKCWQNGFPLALPQSVDFKPVWRLWSIKRSSARPLRIVLPSLIVSVAIGNI